jgi:hypothetical protein
MAIGIKLVLWNFRQSASRSNPMSTRITAIMT